MKKEVMGCLSTIVYIWAALATVVIFAGLFFMPGKTHFDEIFMYVIFGWGPATALYRSNKKAKAADKEWIDTFISSVNVTDKRFIHAEDKTGIAVDDAKYEIILANATLTKRYSLSDVRSWEIKSVTPGVMTGGSNAAGNLGHNLREHANAIAGTGLFIQMKDIDNPEWRIAMLKDDDRKRWFEILNQKING